MDLTPKQQTSEAIRQAENILILTGQHPSVDQAAAVIALGMILRKFGKKASAVISDSLPSSTSLLDTTGVEQGAGGMRDFILKVDSTKAQVDKLRYEMIDSKLNIFITPYQGSFAPSDVTFDYGKPQMQYDIAIVLGVPTRARIDKVYEQNQSMFEQIPVLNIDFHRSNENYGAVNLIEPTASSLCEMLVALSESLQGGSIDEPIATALLMGIIGSTDRFAAAHTTSKSLTVAAQMMAAGAKQQAVIRALYRDGKPSGGNESRGDHNRDARSDNRQNDRRSSQPQQQTQQSQAQPQPERRPRQVEPQPQPQPEPPQEARRAEPIAEVRTPEPTFAPVGEDDGFPIIQPSHIEMSEPEPTAFEPQEVPAMPEMADFAAAAEILAKRQEDDLTDAEA